MADWRALGQSAPALRLQTLSGKLALVILSLSSIVVVQAASVKVTILPGCNFTGSSLPGSPIANVSSARACGQLCEANSRCNVFTFGTRRCFLKSEPGVPDYSRSLTSSGVVDRGRGSNCLLVANTAINSPGVPGYRINDLPSADVCCALCFAVPQCNAFAFSNISTNGFRACFLKGYWDQGVTYGGNTDFFSGAVFRVPTYPPDNQAMAKLNKAIYTLRGTKKVHGVRNWAENHFPDSCATIDFNQGFTCETEVIKGTSYKRVKTLNFHVNIMGQMYGSMAAAADLTALTSFQLNGLKIDPLPNSIFNKMPKLTSVNLNISTFAGGFPKFNIYNKKLVFLSISNQYNTKKLTGSFPTSLFSLPLRQLLLEGNSLGGLLPSVPTRSPWKSSLTVLDLSRNNFRGPLHSTWLRLPRMQNLYLSFNRFSGSLPAPNPGARIVLVLQNNRFTGSVPSLDKCPAFSIHLDNNFFNNTLRIRLSKSIIALFLQTNRISGFFPNLTSYRTLQVLDLSNNLLTGALNPAHVPHVENLKLSNNRLTGVLSRGSIHVGLLDLSRNRLKGPVPPGLAGVYRAGLNLSYNQMEGGVPSIGFFQNISGFADLSHNKLSSSLPSSLGDLAISLHLSNNALTGKLPGGRYQHPNAGHGGQGGFRSGNRPGNCHYCKKEGHFKFECPKKAEADKKYQNWRTRQQANAFANESASAIMERSVGTSASTSANATVAANAGSTSHGGEDDSWLIDSASFARFSGQRLHLANNKLSGAIPPKLMSAVSSASLHLSRNAFTGSPPDFFAQPSNFLSVSVSHNKLSGNLPPSILKGFQSTSRPYTADFSYNQLSGSLGSRLSRYDLFLQGNFFHGPVPTRTGLGPRYRLLVRENCLSGRSCSGNCSSIPQRTTARCSSFCGANTATGPCSGHGICSFNTALAKYQCQCAKGYRPSADGWRCL